MRRQAPPIEVAAAFQGLLWAWHAPRAPDVFVTLPAPVPAPCSENDCERLRFLYEEWAHPYFVSKEEYGRIMEVRWAWAAASAVAAAW